MGIFYMSPLFTSLIYNKFVTRECMKKIILIDDCKEIFTLVEHSVKFFAKIEWAQDFISAQKSLSQQEYDLALIDLELPDGNGLDLCFNLQINYPHTPFFIITSHTALSEKIIGFNAGADDYIVKPFEPLELRARIESRLKKVEFIKNCSNNLNWKELQIDKLCQEVMVLDNNKFTSVNLTALEFKLLMFFASRQSQVISRDDFLNEIWGDEVHVYARSVDTHVSKLRKKLSPVSHVIESIHGVGYKFTPTTSY